MAGQMALAFVAGMLSTLSPCVLPLLPVLVAGALRQNRLAPVALAAGLALSFTATGLAVASLGIGSGLDGVVIRQMAAGLMIAFGVVMMSARLQSGFAAIAGRMSVGASGRLNALPGDGLGGQFAVGLLLGAVWSPCIGPTLGAAIGLAAQSQALGQAALVMAAFGLGGAAPVLVLGAGAGRLFHAKRQTVQRLVHWLKPVTGIILVLVGALVISGVDKVVETTLTQALPPWLLHLTTLY